MLPDVQGEVYPGWWDEGWVGRGTTRVPTQPSQDPIFNIFKAKGPTYGQMKAFLVYFMRFPEMGPRLTSDGSQIDLRLTSE